MLGETVFACYLACCNALLRLPGHTFRTAVLRRLVRVQVGPHCAIERGVRITTKGGLKIGAGTNINARTLLDARGGLTIGERVNISPQVQIITADHDPASPAFAGRLRGVVVADGVWLAQSAIVLPGSRIGEGAVVAAGAVARGDVPPRTIVAGNPAVAVGVRPPDAQSELAPYRRFAH